MTLLFFKGSHARGQIYVMQLQVVNTPSIVFISNIYVNFPLFLLCGLKDASNSLSTDLGLDIVSVNH